MRTKLHQKFLYAVFNELTPLGRFSRRVAMSACDLDVCAIGCSLAWPGIGPEVTWSFPGLALVPPPLKRIFLMSKIPNQKCLVCLLLFTSPNDLFSLHCNGETMRIGQKIQCFPCAGFSHFPHFPSLAYSQSCDMWHSANVNFWVLVLLSAHIEIFWVSRMRVF